MEAIEIREKKGSVYFSFIFLPILVIGFAYYVFLSESPQVKLETKYIFVALLFYSSYMIYVDIKRFKNKKPILIISRFSIEILDDFKTRLFLWQDVKNWKVELDEGVYYLVLETYNIKMRVSISNLDMSPEQIETIITKFYTKWVSPK